MPIDKLLLEERFKAWEKTRKPADVNDNQETLDQLKQARPQLYYERHKERAKWDNPVRQFIKSL
jgi:hypothetical protein